MISLSMLWVVAQLAQSTTTIAPSAWRIVSQQSGPTNYYAVVKNDDGQAFLRSMYVPPFKTAVVGWKAPDSDRQRIKKVRWSWRAQTLPAGGDECTPRAADSAAVVYFTWKRGLRYYTLKYVWSAVGTKGRTCDAKRNPFIAQDTIILETGGPLGEWKTEEIDLAAEFSRHFASGDPKVDVPDFAGIGLMSDGDQTRSPSSADFGDFTLMR